MSAKVKTKPRILSSLVAFVVPRLLWHYFAQYFYNPPLQQVATQSMETRRWTAPPAPSQTLAGALSAALVVPQTLSNQVGASLHDSLIRKYTQLLDDVERWLVQDQKLLSIGQTQKLLHATRNRLQALEKPPLSELFHSESPTNTARPLCVFLMGRRGSGKSEWIRALLGVEHLSDRETVWVGSHGLSVQKSVISIGIGEAPHPFVEFYEFPSFLDRPVAKESITTSAVSETLQDHLQRFLSVSDNPSLQLFQDFLRRQSCLPDAIVYLSEAKEMHSQLPQDILLLQTVSNMMQKHCLVAVRIPLLLCISHVDDVYPGDIKLAHEYDNEKRQSIRQLEQLADRMLEECCHLSEKGASAVRLYPLPAIGVGLKTYWMDRVIASDNPAALMERVVNPKRDYRYNVDAVRERLQTLGPLRLASINQQHRLFALHLVDLFACIANASSAKLSVSLWSKYQLEAYLVAIIALEFLHAEESEEANGSPSAAVATTTPVADPLSFAMTFKSFWQTIGLSPLTLHSLKPVTEHLLRQLPLLGHAIAELELVQDMVGLEDAMRRLGEAAVAYFVERRSEEEVREVFAGKKTLHV